MKRASYRDGVAWIAENDEPLDRNATTIGEYVSTGLLADIFGVTTDKVAKDVLRYREKHEEDMP